MSNHPLVTVGGLIVASDGDILLVRSKKWHDLYSLPGGKVERGETREAAFVREIWEETKLKVMNVRFAIVQDCIFPTEFWREGHFVMNDFIADLDPLSTKEQVELNKEAYDYLWVSPEEALKLPLQHHCRVLVEWYLKHLRASSGIIGIYQYQIDCIIGIYPQEREQEQTLLIDLKAKLDLSRCFASGQFHETVDYVALAQLCTRLAQKKYFLLETFASDILDHCLRDFPIEWAWTRIHKPSAILKAAYAYIELERSRTEGS